MANNNRVDKIIQRLAVKAKLTIRCFEARKEDREVSDQTVANYGAKKGVASVRKSIVSRAYLKPLTDIRAAARSYHRMMTSPWGESGERILNAVLVQEYKTKMRQFEQEYTMAVNSFKAQYPVIIMQEAANLGSMYKIGDYPGVSELDDKFEFSTYITPVESSDDFRVNLAESVLSELKKEVYEQEKLNQFNITKDLYERLYAVISDMVDRISAKKDDSQYKTFTKTAIENPKRLIDILPKLNINQDPGLVKLHEDISQRLADVTADEIRANDHLRAKTIADGEKILEDIENRIGSMYALPKKDKKVA